MWIPFYWYDQSMIIGVNSILYPYWIPWISQAIIDSYDHGYILVYQFPWIIMLDHHIRSWNCSINLANSWNGGSPKSSIWTSYWAPWWTSPFQDCYPLVNVYSLRTGKINLVCGIPTPLTNMSSPVGIWKNKIHVPNHQPDTIMVIIDGFFLSYPHYYHRGITISWFTNRKNMWFCPILVAKLVNITPITMVYGRYNYTYYGL